MDIDTQNRDRVARLNTLFKMFGISARVEYNPEHRMPFFLHGIFGGMAQGMCRTTMDEIEAFAHPYMNKTQINQDSTLWGDP